MPELQRKNNLSISNVDQWQPPTEPIPNENWKPPTEPIAKQELAKPEEPGLLERAWEFGNKPLVNITPEMQRALSNLSEENPILGGMGQFGVGALTSLSSPLSLGLTALTGGANLAEKAGLGTIGSMLETPGKLAAGSMVGHGLYNVYNQPTMGGKFGGAVEASLGGLGLRKGKIKAEIPESFQNLPEINHEMPPEFQAVGSEKVAPQTRFKDTDQFAYDLARKKLNMGLDVPSDGPKPLIKDYWITNKEGKKILNPKYQNLGKSKFGGMRDNSNFTEGSGGLSDIAAGRFKPHAMPNQPTAIFKGYQETMNGDPIPLYNIKGGPHNNSTVAIAKLKELGIEVPKTPSMDEAGYKGTRASKETKIEKPTLANLVSGETGAIRFGANKEKPIRPHTKVEREPQQEIIDKLVNALSEAAPKRETQEKLYSIERAKRIQKAEQVGKTGLPGFYAQLHELKGELPKVDFERTKLSQSDVNDLINYVTNSKRLLPFEKIRAKMGLLKILSAKREELPQRNELALLGEVFGSGFDKIIEMHGGFGGPVSGKQIADMANASKAMMASIDTSAMLRQGAPLIHKAAWRESVGPMLHALTNDTYSKALQESILDRPGYLLGKEAGLELTSTNHFQGMEEAFASKLVQKVPGVKASERAYVAFLNKLRADTFDTLILEAQDTGIELYKDGALTKDVRDIARFVNNATGRGDLAHVPFVGQQLDNFLQKNAIELNAIFFSPKLMASRMAALNPNYYIQLEPFARKEAFKSLAAVASTSLIANGLMAAMGAKVSYDLVAPTWNANLKMFPVNTDFAKSKFGNTRMDPNAGYQQYVVAMARLIAGKEQSSTSNKTMELGGKKGNAPTRTSLIFGVGDKYRRSFMENKFSPLVGLADDILSARQPDKNGVGGLVSKNYSADVINRFVPMVVNDMIDIYRDDPNKFPLKSLLGVGAATGMGMQTYQPQSKKSAGMRIRP